MLPSPAWKTLAMRRSYFFADRLDDPQDVRQLRPRHDAVLRAVARAPAGRRRRTPACGTSTAAAARPRCWPGAPRGPCSSWRSRSIRSASSSRPGLQAVHLHDEHRPGVEREAEVERRLDRLRGSACRASPGPPGTMPAPMMSLMVLVASSTVSKTPSSVRYASGLRVMPHPDLR